MRQIELSPVGRTEVYSQRKFGHDSIVVDTSIGHSGKRYFIVEYAVFGSDIGVSCKPLVDGTVYALFYAPLYGIFHIVDESVVCRFQRIDIVAVVIFYRRPKAPRKADSTQALPYRGQGPPRDPA